MSAGEERKGESSRGRIWEAKVEVRGGNVREGEVRMVIDLY